MAKQFYGVERALGGIFYTRGGFTSQDDFLWLVESQEMGNASLSAARQFSPLVDQVYKDVTQDNATFENRIHEMRLEIRQKGINS